MHLDKMGTGPGMLAEVNRFTTDERVAFRVHMLERMLYVSHSLSLQSTGITFTETIVLVIDLY